MCDADLQAVENDWLTNIPIEVGNTLIKLALGHIVPVFLCQNPASILSYIHGIKIKNQ